MISLQQKLVLGLATIFVVIGGTMVYDASREIASQDDTFANAQESAGTTWTLPEISGEGDGTTPVIKGARTEPLSGNEVFAKLTFLRPSTGKSLVRGQPLFVGDGVSTLALRRGPGHYPETAGLGEAGNLAIAGHRTGWGSPFRRLNDLKKGDLIILESQTGDLYEYRVVRKFITDPTDLSVLSPTPIAGSEFVITLTTCDPPNTSERRLIVQGVLGASE